VAKTLVDIDERLLRQAADALETRTKKETINAALREVANRKIREDELAWWRTDPLPDLRDSEVMERAWR
jgi:Arc/MetJ family transcription regulator